MLQFFVRFSSLYWSFSCFLCHFCSTGVYSNYTSSFLLGHKFCTFQTERGSANIIKCLNLQVTFKLLFSSHDTIAYLSSTEFQGKSWILVHFKTIHEFPVVVPSPPEFFLILSRIVPSNKTRHM